MRRIRKSAPRIPGEVMDQLAAGLVPLEKDPRLLEHPSLREALLSVGNPATARFNVRSARLVGDACASRKWETKTPGAMRVLKGSVPGYLLLEPVLHYDSAAADQYQLNWSKGGRRASISLTGAFLPLGLEVPEDWVWEVPVSLEDLGKQGQMIVLHLHARTERPEKSPRKK